MSVKYYGQLFDNVTITAPIKRALEKTRKEALNIVREATPVRTGKLKSGWGVTSKGFGLVYENATPYGIFVEMGTRHFAPRAMVQRSLPAIAKAFKKNIGAEVGKQMAKKVLGGVSAAPTTYEGLTTGYAPKNPVYGGIRGSKKSK